MWRLNGANPSFRNTNFGFSQQHDARWVSENSTRTVLSLYNNGYNGFNRTHEYSSGMIILIDHENKTATQIHDYAPPGNNMLSSSQGNMQLLPNGNVFMGWGNNEYVSEHDAGGNLLLWGYIAQERVMNYRAQKFQWEGNPTDVPALWTYSKTAIGTSFSSSSMTFYVSWNGATRVKSWRFYGCVNMTGPYTFLAEVRKTGFETVYVHPSFYLWTYAEAISAQEQSLGQSRKQFTFTPSPELGEFCADDSCENAPAYGFPGDEGARPIIPETGINTVPWVDTGNQEEHDFVSSPSGNGQVSSSSGESTRERIHYLPIWVLVSICIVASAIVLGIFLSLHRWRRHLLGRDNGGNKQCEFPSPDSVDDVDQGRKQSRGSWWNWRPWVGAEREPPRGEYFSLAEQNDNAQSDR